jgi:tricorn protease
VGGGLLGADWEAADGRWRLKRILRGQNWNPGLRAPLTEPGVDAREGDYLVSVDGRPVAAGDNLDRVLEGKAERQVEIALSAKADGSGPRVSTVVPVGDEHRLRRLAWVEERRAIVDRLSGGKLAYVYMPDTGDDGLASFERDFYSQVDRRGLVLDERYNGGGKVADHVIALLQRKVLCWWGTREGWVGRTPFGTLQGPKVMVINESAGSGGDAMPWMFRKAGVGPLVGTRTWGGLVGISGYPPLMDGGSVTAASFGIIDTAGNWVVENEGVAPDYEVVEKPADAAAGRDPQLEKAVAVALDLMKTWKYDEVPAPKPPTPR